MAYSAVYSSEHGKLSSILHVREPLIIDVAQSNVCSCALQVTANTVLYDDWCAMLLRMIKHLPALARLNVYFNGDLGNMRRDPDECHGLPRCEELAKLHSRSLTQLRVCMLDGPEDANLLLHGLPELRSCWLLGYGLATELNLRIDPHSFKGALKLQELRAILMRTWTYSPAASSS